MKFAEKKHVAHGLFLLLAGGLLAMTLLLLLPTVSVDAQDRRQPALAMESETVVDSDQATAMDATFQALRDASRSGDLAQVDALSASLSDYDIPSYVDYYRLKPRLPDLVASGEQVPIRAYLARYAGSAIADRLRNDWLLELGKIGDWRTFDEQFPQYVVNDDTQVKCYALISEALKGMNVATPARALLTTPKNYGTACTDLVGVLVQGRQFTDDDVWFQVRLAAESGNAAVLRRYAPYVEATSSQLNQALTQPSQTVRQGPGGPDAGRARHEIFIMALGRTAKNDLSRAVTLMNQWSDQLTPQERATAWAQIALPASTALDPQALTTWQAAMREAKGQPIPLSMEAYQWRVRAALRASNWPMVKASIDDMPQALRSEATWMYWLGRADRMMGHESQAQRLFAAIADQTNFYGQLALEELGKKIVVIPISPVLRSEDIATMAANAGLRRALRFFDMGMRFEGVREWNWELRKMNDRQLLAAAEFARQNDVLDRMVNTSDRTKTEVDFHQRFPTPHRDIMEQNTQALGLDLAWVYGLIRQESRFAHLARSHVGASGLMQLMPATAKWVAKKMGMSDFDLMQVNDIQTNIALGTNYLNMVLSNLDGSQALASAAYNAGPKRPQAWRSTLPGRVEGAIFAESIPFEETRGYVKNVLSNATYYEALFQGTPQSLKSRLGQVAPAGFEASVPPSNAQNAPNSPMITAKH